MNEQQVFQGLSGFTSQQQTQQQGQPCILRVPVKFHHPQFGSLKCFVEKPLATGTLQEAQNALMGMINEGYELDFWPERQQEQEQSQWNQGQNYQRRPYYQRRYYNRGY